jgi:hypothetical protein
MPDQSAANDQPQGSIYSHILAHLRPDGPGLEYEGRFLPDEEPPVPNHKALGLRGLHALMVDAWPPGADALVEEIARSDPDRDRRRWATEVLASRSG